MSTAFRYAVVDLAVVDDLGLPLSRCLPSIALSLFSASFPAEVIYAGPWVVDLGQAEGFAERLAALSPDLPWGYIIRCNIDIVSLRHSLRRFNLIEIPNPPREVLFRYWDPRVLRVFLQVGTPHSVKRFFDFIEAIEYADGSIFVPGPEMN